MTKTPRLLSFGEALGFLRSQQRLTIDELGDLVGWPGVQIQAIEEGRHEHDITRAEAAELAKALDVDPKMLTVAVPR